MGLGGLFHLGKSREASLCELRPAGGEGVSQREQHSWQKEQSVKRPRDRQHPVIMAQEGGWCVENGRRWGQRVSGARPQGLVGHNKRVWILS